MMAPDLTFLSTEELVSQARFTWLHVDIGNIAALCDRNPAFIADYVQGKKVIDIGCGRRNNLGEKVIALGAETYVGVDPFNLYLGDIKNTEKRRYVQSDGLTFLLSQPDNEAVIIASSLLGEALMPTPFDDFKKQEIKEEYLRRLINEVYRVTETVCLGFELCRLAQKYAESAGFSVLRYASVGLAPTEYPSLEDFFIMQKRKLAEGRLK